MRGGGGDGGGEIFVEGHHMDLWAKEGIVFLAIFLMRVYLYFLLVFKRRNNSGNRL